jgi:hypothetical protein
MHHTPFLLAHSFQQQPFCNIVNDNQDARLFLLSCPGIVLLQSSGLSGDSERGVSEGGGCRSNRSSRSSRGWTSY